MSSDAPPETAARAGAKQWFGLVLLLLPTVVLTMDLGVLWLAAPYLAADLAPSGSQLLWITDIYGFVIAGLLVTTGTLGDRIGRRKLLLIGAVLFGAASAAAAFATSAEALIAARALLGIAGACLMPSTLALIANMFTDEQQRGRAIAMWVTAMSVGIALGPVAGGVLLGSFWWGSVFLIGVPVMALVAIGGRWLLPEYRDPQPGRIDLVSVALFMVMILPVIFGIKKFAEAGFDGKYVLAIAIGLAFGVVFVRRQRSLDDPLLDVSLFKNRVFTAALALMMLGMGAMNGVEYLVPQYLQMVKDLTPLRAGLWLLIGAAGVVIGSQLTPYLAQKIRPAYVVAWGGLFAAIGFAVLAFIGTSSGIWVAATALALLMFGLSPVMVLGTDLIVGSGHAEKAGSASAVSITGGDLGVSLGIAVIGSVSTAVFRQGIDGSLPSGIPASVAEDAKDTIGGAVAATDKLPTDLAAQVMAPAKDAFTNGLNAAAGVSTGLVLVLGVIALTILRNVGAETPEPAGEGEPATAAGRDPVPTGDPR